MASRTRQRRFCGCGTLLARDNSGRHCARCERARRDKLITPPEVPPDFWRTEQFRDAFAARHMGRISRVYRMHPAHRAVYGRDGISQTLLGQWLGLRQPQISRFENGPPLQLLDTLQHWAQTLRIPAQLLWFRMPDDTHHPASAEPAPSDQGTPSANTPNPNCEPTGDPERDPVLVAPWNHRGTVEAVVVLSGGDRMKRRTFLSLTGPALTAPAHQWLIHEPEPLLSGLSGRRISAQLVDQFTPMIAELRRMDDVAGGGSVLNLAQQQFNWAASLLDRASYDDTTGRKLLTALAELGQFCGWSAYDAGNFGLAQRYYIAGLRAAHSTNDRPLGAHILSCMAEQAAWGGHPTEAVTLIDTALAGTRGHQAPRLLAELSIRQAISLAIMGDVSACTTAVSKARNHVEPLDDDPLWLYWVSPADITAFAGNCMLQVGQVDRAATLIEEGITLFDELFLRDRQLYSIHLADALSRPGPQRDLDVAAKWGIEAIELAEHLDTTRSVGYLSDLYRRLKPHAQVPAVGDFLERSKSFMEN